MTDLLPPIYDGFTSLQRAFVHQFTINGGNGSDAAEKAGFSTRGGSNRVTAHRLLRDPRIQRAIKFELETKVKAGAVVAMNSLLTLAEKALSESVRLQAAQAVLDRAGMLVSKVQDININIEDRRTTKEIVANIRALAAANGLDATKLLGLTEAPIDAEFDEVPAGKNGLEDLL